MANLKLLGEIMKEIGEVLFPSGIASLKFLRPPKTIRLTLEN
jgi:hypothetical protein